MIQTYTQCEVFSKNHHGITKAFLAYPPPQVIRERGGPAFKEGEEDGDQPVATAADQEDHGEGGGGAPDK